MQIKKLFWATLKNSIYKCFYKGNLKFSKKIVKKLILKCFDIIINQIQLELKLEFRILELLNQNLYKLELLSYKLKIKTIKSSNQNN